MSTVRAGMTQASHSAWLCSGCPGPGLWRRVLRSRERSLAAGRAPRRATLNDGFQALAPARGRKGIAHAVRGKLFRDPEAPRGWRGLLPRLWAPWPLKGPVSALEARLYVFSPRTPLQSGKRDLIRGAGMTLLCSVRETEAEKVSSCLSGTIREASTLIPAFAPPNCGLLLLSSSELPRASLKRGRSDRVRQDRDAAEELSTCSLQGLLRPLCAVGLFLPNLAVASVVLPTSQMARPRPGGPPC